MKAASPSWPNWYAEERIAAHNTRSRTRARYFLAALTALIGLALVAK